MEITPLYNLTALNPKDHPIEFAMQAQKNFEDIMGILSGTSGLTPGAQFEAMAYAFMVSSSNRGCC